MMSQKTRTIVDASWYLACFLFIQAVCTVACAAFSPGLKLTQTALSLCMLASSIITIGLYWWNKWWIEKKEYVKSVPAFVYSAIFFVAVCSIMPSMAMLEAMGVEANEQQERIMLEIISSPLGFLIIALLVPLAEEIVFRGAVLRTLLNYFNPWLAIVVSSVLFGLVHGNLAQFIHATLLGIFLGWIYYHTRSILPGVVFHFLNNAVSFALIKWNPNMNEATLSDFFGGNTMMMSIALVVFIAVIALAIWLLDDTFVQKNGKQ